MHKMPWLTTAGNASVMAKESLSPVRCATWSTLSKYFVELSAVLRLSVLIRSLFTQYPTSLAQASASPILKSLTETTIPSYGTTRKACISRAIKYSMQPDLWLQPVKSPLCNAWLWRSTRRSSSRQMYASELNTEAALKTSSFVGSPLIRPWSRASKHNLYLKLLIV